MIIITKNKTLKTVIRNKVSCSTFILIITNTHPSLRKYLVRLDKMFISHVQPTNVCLRVPLNYENDLNTEVSRRGGTTDSVVFLHATNNTRCNFHACV